ncbi:sialidase family protein [Arachnia propionica]|nr:sialidase family protein [Arachnia propionica]
MSQPLKLIRLLVTCIAVTAATLLGAVTVRADEPGRTGLQSFDLDRDLDLGWTSQKLADGGTAGFTCSRIPALTTANNGWVIAAWDGRPGTCADAPQPNSIVYTVSKDDGATWSEVKVMAQGNPDPEQRGFSDPSFVVDRETGRIFAFFVMSYDWGWPQRDRTITDPRHVMHAVHFHSDDNGETWEGPTEVTDALNPAPRNEVWTGRFAASGEGIQLRYGTHAGRLIQQYTVYNTVTDDYWAVSLYSDDHGATWQAGAPVGPGMDENKVVELSDGTVMLNSRKSDGTGGRYVARSTDGGETWSERTTDHTLIDPQNNASIIRAFPNAPEGSADAKVLLFSNSAASSRTNGTIRVSFDDGRTWSDSTVFEPGAMSYSTMTTLADGSLGILYERSHPTIWFGKLSWKSLGATGITMTSPTVLHRGENQVEITIANPVGEALPAGQLHLSTRGGLTGDAIQVPTVPAGGTVTVMVPLTLPADANPGPLTLQGNYVVEGRTVVKEIPVTVELRDGEEITDKLLEVLINRKSEPQESYQAGDKVSFWVRVSNRADHAITAYPVGDGWENLFPTCRWANLPTQPRGNYNCGLTGNSGNNPPTYTITAQDIERGWFIPTMTWKVAAANDREARNPIQTLTFTGEKVLLPTSPQETPEPKLELSTAVVPYRTILIARLSGFQPEEQVALQVGTRRARTVTADAEGRATLHQAIDRRSCPETCTVTATGEASGQVSAEFRRG